MPRLAALLLVIAAGCAPDLAGLGRPLSHGAPGHGYLAQGVALADSGPGFVRARPGEATRFGTASLVAALTSAARSVHERFAGGAALRVGDLSAPLGGKHGRHGSHRSGRDADVMFYATDGRAAEVPGSGAYVFDRFGVGRRVAAGGQPAREPQLVLLDEARNWHFVRTLLLDEAATVQWIFCSNGVKARLLRYAVGHEPEPEALVRAAYVLHQPSSGRTHNDHFHIRVACTPEERAAGCYDRGPVWPWHRLTHDKLPQAAEVSLDDASLLAWLMQPAP